MPYHQESLDSLNPVQKYNSMQGPKFVQDSKVHSVLIVGPEAEWSVPFMRANLLQLFMKHNAHSQQAGKAGTFLLYSPDNPEFAEFASKIAELAQIPLGILSRKLVKNYSQRNVPLNFAQIYAYRSEIPPVFAGPTKNIRPIPRDRVNESPFYPGQQIDNLMAGGDKTPVQTPAQKVAPDQVFDAMTQKSQKYQPNPNDNPYGDMDYRPVRWTRIPLTLSIGRGAPSGLKGLK